MAGMFSKVSVAITASTGGLARSLSTATSLIAKFGRIASAPIRIPLGIGFLAAAKAVEITYAAVRKFGAAVNFAVQQAASLTEQQNRVDKVFGESAKSVRVFAKSASAIGFAETQALAATGTFGTLFNNIGLTEQQSASMSMELTKLTSDMASFNEVRVDDALRAMRSALVGEVEPIRRLGIVLNDAALRQEAFAMGLTKTTSVVLTPAQKMMAAYSSIIKQAGIQQGDFADTSGTLSNQQRIARSNVQNLAAELGQKLKPAFLAAVSAFNSGFNSIKALIELISQNIFAPFIDGIGASLDLSDLFAGSLRMIGIAITIVSGGFQMFYGILQLGAAVFEGLREASLLALDSIRDSIADVTFVFGAFITGLEQGVRNVASVLLVPIQTLMKGLASALEFVGQEGFADTIRKSVEQMETIADRSSGVGERIQNQLSEQIRGGLLGDMAEEARANAQAYGEEAARNMQVGLDSILDPTAAFDAAKMKIDMESVINDIIPAVGNAAASGVSEVAAAAQAATASLKAINVNTSAGEEFRNSILRGADPRLAQSSDQKLVDNTERTADGVADLPGALGDVLAGQFAAATVSV